MPVPVPKTRGPDAEEAFLLASSSPVISLKGQVIHGQGACFSETRTVFRSSPSRRKHQSPLSPETSFFESRLPVRRTQASIAAFRLPPALMSPSKSVAIASSMAVSQESLTASIGGTPTAAVIDATNAITAASISAANQGKVTPEKVLAELKAAAAERKRFRATEVLEDEKSESSYVCSPRKRSKKQTRSSMAVDEEISIPGLVAVETGSPETEPVNATSEGTFRRRMSLRNVTLPVSEDIAGSWDPLEVARLTIVNTKVNSGYRRCRLVYRSEQLPVPRPVSPMHGFSSKQAADLWLSSDSSEPDALRKPLQRPRSLRFNRKLNFSPDVIVHEPDLEVTIPLRSCLKPASNEEEEPVVKHAKEVIEVKRVVYADDLLNRKRTALSGKKPQSAARRPLSAAKRTAVKKSNVK